MTKEELKQLQSKSREFAEQIKDAVVELLINEEKEEATIEGRDIPALMHAMTIVSTFLYDACSKKEPDLLEVNQIQNRLIATLNMLEDLE